MPRNAVPLNRKHETIVFQSHVDNACDKHHWTCVKYHRTIVVRFNSHTIILDSGGHRTATTKRRMNEAAMEFQLCFSVHQLAGSWYVMHHGIEYSFTDRMELRR